MVFMNRFGKRAVVAVIVSVFGICAAPIASASVFSSSSIESRHSAISSRAADSATQVSGSPMNIGGIDEDAARRAGNIVSIEGNSKVLYDGTSGVEIARIPVDEGLARASATGPTPQSNVPGNCGSSYYWIYDTNGPGKYEFTTGFEVDSPAYDFTWDTVVEADWGSGIYHFEWSDAGPQVPSSSWTSGFVEDTSEAPFYTWHYGRVTAGTAYLVSGAICYSGLPNAGVYVL